MQIQCTSTEREIVDILTDAGFHQVGESDAIRLLESHPRSGGVPQLTTKEKTPEEEGETIGPSKGNNFTPTTE